jgi:serine protease Do
MQLKRPQCNRFDGVFGIFRNGWRHRGILRNLCVLILACGLAATVCALPTRAQTPDTSGDTLHKLNESVDNLIKKVSPSVVQILVTGYGPLDEGERTSTSVIIGRQRAIGSGFVIDPSGYIVTNAHVVNGAQLVRVVLPLGTNEGSVSAALSTRSNIVPARVVGVARDIDLALLKVDGVKLNALPVASYHNLRQGEIVFAFGSPEGLRNTVTMGIISAVARQTDLDSPMVYVQTDAPINPGNSGGPLVNVNGEVVGVNTFILSQSGGNEGLGFAIPCGVLNVAYKQLRQFGHLHKTEIGIGIQTITPTLATALKLPRAYGVIISDVKPNTPAIAAGVQIGDILLSIDGRPAENLPFVGLQFLSRDNGDKMHLEILRGKDRLAFDVKVMDPPHDMDQIAALADPEKSLVPALGILGVEIDEKVAGMAPDLRDPFGILVAARAAGASIEVPLATGDVIRTLNGEPMTTLDRLRAALKALPPGSSVALQIQRDERLLYIAFTTEVQ